MTETKFKFKVTAEHALHDAAYLLYPLPSLESKDIFIFSVIDENPEACSSLKSLLDSEEGEGDGGERSRKCGLFELPIISFLEPPAR